MVKIRSAERDDLTSILSLMKDFAMYEGLVGVFTADRDRLEAAMFGSEGFVKGVVVEAEDKLVGYALFYPNFASFRGQRGIYLEDVYVAPEHQGKGVGEAILRKIARMAKANRCERMDFQVLEWNKPAIGFYEKLGALRDDSERHFKFTDAAFEKLAS
jgi:ribosomal protein S18 acetylase RimI-like enzyme